MGRIVKSIKKAVIRFLGINTNILIDLKQDIPKFIVDYRHYLRMGYMINLSKLKNWVR